MSTRFRHPFWLVLTCELSSDPGFKSELITTDPAQLSIGNKKHISAKVAAPVLERKQSIGLQVFLRHGGMALLQEGAVQSLHSMYKWSNCCLRRVVISMYSCTGP